MGTDAIEAGETPFDSYPSSFEKQNILSSHNQEQSKKRGEKPAKMRDKPARTREKPTRTMGETVVLFPNLKTNKIRKKLV
ncbi:hypothetical protein ES332_D09G133000v1 [Gossypium tomentosum]|uniref:Uncharacterized protein n=1 Tax=Gossypium tomentosum TaxID=34277 RepID=A0A5D2JHJ5_GOSTO|nr:hypothetical protein ES332_D09G133000v1 [Gossypium tomentosum]